MTGERRVLTPDVLVIGGGPAGLTAAAALAARVKGEVLVFDREQAAGGIPRHSDHTGFGLRDLHRVMKGPAYARHLVDKALAAGATIGTESMVTGWPGDRRVEVTTPRGLLEVDARAIVLATGARERPRPARRVPGDRPHGVYTTGQLQNLVHLHHQEVGTRAVVVGAELVSWSAVLTLREAACKTALMTSEYAKPEAYAVFTAAGRSILRVPVSARTRVTRIIGRDRVQAIEIEQMDTGRRRIYPCDTVVFTGDWIPDHELARLTGLDLDPATLGPLVDTAMRTSRPGVFAAGNLVHPVDTADVAALDGKHVADQVIAWLDGGDAVGGTAVKGVHILADPPFRWVVPQILRPGDPPPPRARLLLWTDELVNLPRVTVRQDGRLLASRTLAWPAAPGRMFRVPSHLLNGVSPTKGPIHIGLA